MRIVRDQSGHARRVKTMMALDHASWFIYVDANYPGVIYRECLE